MYRINIIKNIIIKTKDSNYSTIKTEKNTALAVIIINNTIKKIKIIK